MCLVIISVSYRQNAASHSIMRRDRQSLSRLMGRPPNRLGCRFCGRPGVLCASGHVDTPSVSVWILCTRLCALVPNRHGASQLLVAVGSGVANRLVGDMPPLFNKKRKKGGEKGISPLMPFSSLFFFFLFFSKSWSLPLSCVIYFGALDHF